jgi:flagellar basal body-associated protein FliL
VKRERGSILIVLLLVLVLVFGAAFTISYVFFDRTPSEVAEEAKEQIQDSGGSFWDGIKDIIDDLSNDEDSVVQ